MIFWQYMLQRPISCQIEYLPSTREFGLKDSQSLLPIRAVEGAVLDCFRHVLGLDLVGPFEIRNGTRNPQDPVVGASREPQPSNRIFHQLLAFPIQFAETADRARGHLGIAENAEGFETARLALPSGQNPFSDYC